LSEVLLVKTGGGGILLYGIELAKRIRCQSYYQADWHDIDFLGWNYKLLHLTSQRQGHLIPYVPEGRIIVVTIHDCIQLCLGFDSYPSAETLLSKLDAMSLPKAHHIVTVSEYSKQDIIKHLGIPDEKITVIYNGVSDEFQPSPERIIPHPYILYVGDARPRKNLGRTLQAFKMIREGYPEMKFVKYGRPHPAERQFREEVRILGLENSVIHFEESLDYGKLSSLYTYAECMVWVSLYEGFGLPPVEAMKCGCPVVTSNTSCIPEIVGDGAILVDPYDVEDIARGVYIILEDEKTRSDLKKRAQKRAEKYTWDKSAQEHEALYKRLLDERRTCRKWRSEDWHNPYLPVQGPPHPMWRYEANAYELGADAMLEALEKRGLYIGTDGNLYLREVK